MRDAGAGRVAIGRRAATGRWTATAAGSASSAPTTCSSTAGAEHRARPAPTAVARRLRARRDRRVHQADAGRRGGAGSAPATRVLRFNFRPDRMREITRALAEPGFAEVDRGGARAGRALRDDDRVRGGLALPGRVRRRSTRRRRCRVCSPARRPPAARRRDREVRARDVLLQRRRARTPCEGEGRDARALAARRADLRPQARDERARGRRRVRRRVARGPPRFAIINFANADMVGHTGVIAGGRAGRRRRSIGASARSSRRCTRPAAPASSPPTTATPTTCSRPTAVPNTAHSLNPVPLIVTARRPWRCGAEGILADVAPTVAGAARHRAAGGDDGALADRGLSALGDHPLRRRAPDGYGFSAAATTATIARRLSAVTLPAKPTALRCSGSRAPRLMLSGFSRFAASSSAL